MPPSLLTVFAALVVATPSASAKVYLEIIEVPVDLTPIKAGLFGPPKDFAFSPILSERFAQSREGQRYFKRSPDAYPGEINRVRTYKCPPILKLARPSNTEVIIDIARQRAFLMVNGRMGLETEISSARTGKHTPLGTFRMTERVRDGKISNLYDVEMPFWMRLDETAYGVHAGYLPGYPASAGCIRLPNQAARIIYESTARGSVVRIVNRWTPTVRARPIDQTAGTSPQRDGSDRRRDRKSGKLPTDDLGQTYVRINL